VRVSLAYYTSYPGDIDAWIAEAISERAEHSWRQQQELLG
jgi:Fe-S cluster biosynthesis and repair protein YggX